LHSDSAVYNPIRFLLFCSGITALIYQVIWIKQLGLVVGVNVYAITTGVSAFFAGLAIGSALLGQIADRHTQPLRLYIFLEIGIAVLGVATTIMLSLAPAWFVALQTSVGIIAWLLPFTLVAIPAILMGGTLPPTLAALRPADDAIGRTSGQLYAANTAGAIVGALLAVLVIIPSFGIQGAARFVASLNLLLALAAFAIIASQRGHRRSQAERTTNSAKMTRDSQLALVLYAIAGSIALGYEVVWTQVIVQFLSTRAVAFSVVLATYLLGLVIGSWFFARHADHIPRRWFVFGCLIAGAGLTAMASYALLGPWLIAMQDILGDAIEALTDSRMLEMCTRFAVAATVLILPTTLLLGAAFPAAARLIIESENAGRQMGYVLAVNTSFGIVGTLVTGFWLIPALGLAGSLGILAVGAAIIGSVAISREPPMGAMASRKAWLIVIAVCSIAYLLPKDRLATMLADTRGGKVLYYDEGPAGTVAVLQQGTESAPFRRLYIQGVSNSGDVMASKRYMRLQGLLPLIVHPAEPKSALVIAFGTGITAGSLLAYPDLERRLVVELLQPVINAAPLFDGNYGAGTDLRLEVVIADGRHELMRRKEAFDLITLEPPPPAAAGVVNLYSQDFYELAKSRLNQHGLLAQWLPIATQNDEDTQSLIKSMLEVFPHLTLWTTEVHEMMLIGSEEPLKLDYSTVSQRMRVSTVANALGEVGINSAADLLATYITDRAGLERYTELALPVTDDRPRIEYANWIRAGEFARVLPKLLGLVSPLPLVASNEEQAAVQASFLRLLGFYDIVYRAYGRDRKTWGEQINTFRKNGEANAYYDWYLDRQQNPKP
jgi:spermidine synthase